MYEFTAGLTLRIFSDRDRHSPGRIDRSRLEQNLPPLAAYARALCGRERGLTSQRPLVSVRLGNE